jgi:long-chain fatty acid transport protein
VESPHGLGLEWADHTFDRNLGPYGSADTAKKAEQTIVRAGPAVAWKLNERWRAGVRIFAQYASALDENDLATAEGHGVSPGAQLGLRYHTPDFTAGLAYTSRTNTEIKGGQRDNHPAAAASGLLEGEVHADILLPDRLQTGMAFRLTPRLWWEIDVDWIGWAYVDELTIIQVNGAVANSGKTARHNRNTRSLRTGLRWQKQPDLTFYAGLGYDPSPVPEQDASPITSMLAKTRVGLGASRLLDNGLKLDLAYQLIRGHDRTIGATDQDNTATGDTHLYEGRYRSRSQILAFTLSGNF